MVPKVEAGGSWLGRPGNQLEDRRHMSYVVKTAEETYCRGESHLRAVALRLRGRSATGTAQGPCREPQGCLPRAAPRTRHRLVGRRRVHRGPARPRATPGQLRLRSICRAAGSLTRHGRPGRQRRLEVLVADRLAVGRDTACPDADRVPVRAPAQGWDDRERMPAAGRSPRQPPSRESVPSVAAGAPKEPSASPSSRSPQSSVPTRSSVPTQSSVLSRTSPSSSSWRSPDQVHPLVVCDRACGKPRPGRNHRGKVISPAFWRVLHLHGLEPGRCGPTRTSSPLRAAQHWRSSNDMSRAKATPGPRSCPPMAEARLWSGATR
jgi:hypothetical protein